MSRAGIHTPGSDSDRRLLAFLAAHRLVLASHVRALLDVSHQTAHERLVVLEERRLLRRSRVSREHPGYYQITHLGLAMIASDLPPPSLRLDRCRHDLALAWLWLAVDRGDLGRIDRILTEREQRSHDTRRTGPPPADEADEPPFGVPVPGNPTARHYPDLLLIGNKGELVPVELILTSQGQRQLETLMASYGADPNLAAVLYLAETPTVRHAIKRTATDLGIENLIHIHPVIMPQEETPPAPQ